MNKNAYQILLEVASKLKPESNDYRVFMAALNASDFYQTVHDWIEQSGESPYLKGLTRQQAFANPKTYDALATLFVREDFHNEATVHAWASRIKDINSAIRFREAASRLKAGNGGMVWGDRWAEKFKYIPHGVRSFGSLVQKAAEDRAWEIVGRSNRTAPVREPKVKEIWTPPAIPANIIPSNADQWQLYSENPGSGRAARGLTSALATVLKMIGKHVTPQNKDLKNAANLKAIMARMGKALETYSDLGATDSEPCYVARDAVRRYLKLYLKDWDFPKTFNTIEGWM